MSITPAQLSTFKTDIQSNAGVTALLAAKNYTGIAAFYNGAGTGSVWNPSLTIAQIMTAIVWSEFIALTTAKMTAFQVMTANGQIDATSANIRNGFSTIFAATTTLTNLTAIASKTPTVFEALYASANVTPVYGYVVQLQDVYNALGV
jgi:hypothetical protein